jgi:hypothetical protein
MTTTSHPARIGLVKINGEVGRLIRLGQFLNGDGSEDFEHAFMDLGDGTLIEAEPGGARIRPLSEYDNASVYWCDSIYDNVAPALRTGIALAARDFEGVGYSAADYFALVGHRFGVNSRWLENEISRSDRLICSQLVDLAYCRGGYHIFTDHRWSGYVTPGGLYEQDVLRHRWDTVSWDKTWGMS